VYHILSERLRNSLLYLRRRIASGLEVAYQGQRNLAVLMNRHGSGKLRFIPDPDIQYVCRADLVSV
jgi:hypothetical protein